MWLLFEGGVYLKKYSGTGEFLESVLATSIGNHMDSNAIISILYENSCDSLLIIYFIDYYF